MTELKEARGSKRKRRAANLRLTELRFEGGLTQRRLASLAGLSPGVVQLAEKGFVPHPGHAGAILEVLERRVGRKIRYVDVWPPTGKARG